MGIRTIFNSKRIIMMAWGIQKSHIVKKSVEKKHMQQAIKTIKDIFGSRSLYYVKD